MSLHGPRTATDWTPTGRIRVVPRRLRGPRVDVEESRTVGFARSPFYSSAKTTEFRWRTIRNRDLPSGAILRRADDA
ncbi:hypothetical protein [Breoghania sp.]|uniref:hypothetical protein n=1 Tax=Breoghania sp. TaxID=2065378 RepID=UPI002AAB6FC8|nr:hypothetical protein [Breoghania sp.]